MQSLFETKEKSRTGDFWERWTPRAYQISAHDNTVGSWGHGDRGSMIRIFTSGGKTFIACMLMNTWLNRGPDYRVMVISYEKQLVWQFAQEIEDFLCITPGIEMGPEKCDADDMPKIIVACRQSLLFSPPPTQEQLDELETFGIKNIGAVTERRVTTYLKELRKGADNSSIFRDIEIINAQPEARDGGFSRVHKFDPKLNWLIVMDEAHRHSKKLKTIGPVVDWFWTNPISVFTGMTATPNAKNQDLFPFISVDYALFHATKPCAVRDGYAVPYRQKYISVEGVDFKNVKQVKGDFDEAELEKILGEESTLAKLVQPLLDLVENRKTLIFSPGVEMAKNVAMFINARCRAKCPDCHKSAWYPNKLIGDGSQCSCGHLIETVDMDKWGEQARALWGEIHPKTRAETYKDHQGGKFQFLSVCGLCREGYNDPDISCVAIFRPISEAASYLGEQIKGRGARVLRGLIEGLATREERLAAIAASSKKDCLVVDLVGISGFQDCASTIQIYSEGVDEEVIKQAKKKLAKVVEEDGEADMAQLMNEAQEEVDARRERVRLEREEAERKLKEHAENRAKADAEVKYTAHDVGVGVHRDPGMIEDKLRRAIAFFGLQLNDSAPVSQSQGRRMIGQLKDGVLPAEVARLNRLHAEHWGKTGPSPKQNEHLLKKGLRAETPLEAKAFLNAMWNKDEFMADTIGRIKETRNEQQLTFMAKLVGKVRSLIPQHDFETLVSAGKARRDELSDHGDAYEG